MSDDSLSREEMIEPIERLFDRESVRDIKLVSVVREAPNGPPDPRKRAGDDAGQGDKETSGAGQAAGSGDGVDASQTEIRDLLYLAGERRALHSVRVESDFDTCIFDYDRGVLSLRDVDANYTWVALPLDELREGDREYSGILEDTCTQSGIGIIGVFSRGLGLSAKVIVDAKSEEGDFLEHHPALEAQWREQTRGVLVGDGYRLVEYYNR